MHNIISNLNANSKIPPSELGFVCKPELPPHINILFRARPPLPFLKKKVKSISRSYTGVFDNGNSSNILDLFEKNNDNKKFIVEESKYLKKLKNIIIKNENNKQLNKERIKKWNPKNNPNATGDPYKTLFVYRLDNNTDEKVLKKDFEQYYGRIKKIKMVKDNKGNNKYAFIEFAHSSDLKAVLKDKKNHHIKINGKSVYCDYERGRTDKHFVPRKYGGDLGKNRDMPIWLEEQIDYVKKKYPELTKVKKRKVEESEMEKGEIRDDDDVDMDNNNNNDNNNIENNDNKNNNKNENNNENNNESKNDNKNNNKNENNENKDNKNDNNENKDKNDNNENKDNKNENNLENNDNNIKDNEKKDNNNNDKMELEKGEII